MGLFFFFLLESEPGLMSPRQGAIILLDDRDTCPIVTNRSPFELSLHSAKGQVAELKQS